LSAFQNLIEKNNAMLKLNIKNNITILFVSILFISPVFSQENLTKEEVATYISMMETAEGTYQIQMIDTRELPAIPIALIKTIEEHRKENETVYFFYKNNIRIKVLSRYEIQDNKRLTKDEKIIYISSNNL